MSAYLEPIKMAAVFFPFIAALLTVPFVLNQYHRYGSIPWQRVLIVYSFIFYLMTAYFLVILPLPDRSDPSIFNTASHFEIVPFANMAKYFAKHGFALSLSAIKAFLTSSTVLQTLFNVILTIPFGVYLRYYFKCSKTKTILLTFGLSLFFELTQLTGLYWIYPGAYRTFDVNDLMTNTLGGFIGYTIAPAMLFILPKRQAIDEKAVSGSVKVTPIRILASVFLDFCLYLILDAIGMIVFYMIWPDSSYNVTGLFFPFIMLLTLLGRGYTPGKHYCHLKTVAADGTAAKPTRIMLRYLLLWVPFYGLNYFTDLTDLLFKNSTAVARVINIVCFAVILYFAFVMFAYLFSQKKPLWYAKGSHTKIVSTL